MSLAIKSFKSVAALLALTSCASMEDIDELNNRADHQDVQITVLSTQLDKVNTELAIQTQILTDQGEQITALRDDVEALRATLEQQNSTIESLREADDAALNRDKSLAQATADEFDRMDQKFTARTDQLLDGHNKHMEVLQAYRTTFLQHARQINENTSAVQQAEGKTNRLYQ